MRIRHYSKSKFDLIECPNGARVIRCAVQSDRDTADSHDRLVVPFRGQELTIPADPPELLPLLVNAGQYCLSPVGEPVPDVILEGAVCPKCDEDDVSWLSVEDDSNITLRDNCGSDFNLDEQL
jgi:hypothetical protein